MAFPSFSAPIVNLAGKTYTTSGWGADRSYRGGVHNGLDFPAPIGTPVRAVAGGKVVTVSDWGANGGKAVVIEHQPGLRTRYLHLDRFNVQNGAIVGPGQLIGYSGATGIAASAAHLHFDIRGTQPWVDEYVRRYGRPSPWPGEFTSGGYGIPSEPFIPAVFSLNVIASAKTHGVPLHRSIGLTVAVLAAVGVGAWLLLRRRG